MSNVTRHDSAPVAILARMQIENHGCYLNKLRTTANSLSDYRFYNIESRSNTTALDKLFSWGTKEIFHPRRLLPWLSAILAHLPCQVTVYALHEKPSSFTTPSCRSCCQTTTEPSAQLQGARTSTWWCQDGMFWERLHERTGWVEKMWWRIALAVGDLNLWEDGDKIFFHLKWC